MSKKSATGFMKILEDYFVTYLPFSKGLSPNTIKSYKQSFLLLLDFMFRQKEIPADKIMFSNLNYETLLDFFNWIETERKCKSITRNQRLSAITAFSEYAQNRDFDAASIFRSSINKIPLKKWSLKTRAVFTRNEISLLLALPNERTATGLRDKVLLSIMYASGARTQEICDLTVRNIHFHDGTTTLILTGKGNKTRRIALPRNCAIMLKQFIDYRNIDNKYSRHVFSSQTHEQMTVSCIEGIFKKYVTIAKVQHPNLFPADSYPPHSMRHSTASHLLEAGVDIVTIKNILGHASLQTTQIYTEISQETITKKLSEWNKTWFGEDITTKDYTNERKDGIPEFLRR